MALDINNLHQEFALDATPKRILTYELKKIPCCWLLTNPATERTVKLNETSLMIWQLCSGELSVGEMIETLEQAYEDSPRIAKDVHRTLDDLLEENVIHIETT